MVQRIDVFQWRKVIIIVKAFVVIADADAEHDRVANATGELRGLIQNDPGIEPGRFGALPGQVLVVPFSLSSVIVVTFCSSARDWMDARWPAAPVMQFALVAYVQRPSFTLDICVWQIARITWQYSFAWAISAAMGCSPPPLPASLQAFWYFVKAFCFVLCQLL